MKTVLDVLLVNSPRNLIAPLNKNQPRDSRMPLGLMYISSYLKSRGLQVEIIDAEARALGASEIISNVREKNPGIIGLNCHTLNRFTVYELVKLIKAETQQTLVVLGGTHPTVAAQQTLEECPEIDALVIGEGEETFYYIVQNKEKLEDITGIAFLNKDKKFCHTGIRPRNRNLDDLPFPDPKDVSHENFLNFEDKDLHGLWGRFYILAMRGCLYNCSYCTAYPFWQRVITSRSCENVIREIKHIQNQCAQKEFEYIHKKIRFYFYDDNLTNWPHLEEFCEKSVHLNIDWSCSGRIDHMAKPSLIEQMSRAGCKEIAFGLESGSKKVLKKINKGWQEKFSKRKVGEIINTCREYKIYPRTHFMIGLPWEDRNDIEETVKFAVFLKSFGLTDANFFPAKLFPGTEMYDEVLRMYADRPASVKNGFCNSWIIKDWSHITNRQVKSKLRRFNDIPEVSVHRYLDSLSLRRLARNAYEIFFSDCNENDVEKLLWKGVVWED